MPRRVAVALAVVALATLGVGAAAWLRGSREAPRFVDVTVGETRLSALSAYLRPAARRDGAAQALEFAAFFPDFTPAGDVEDVTGATDLDRRLAQIVFVAVRPADPRLDPADRFDRLYARFLEVNAWSHPGGLVARGFQDDSPFAGDELFYTEPDGREFAARCRKPDPLRKTQNTCQAEFRLGTLDVGVRFAAALLGEWPRLRAGGRGLVEAALR